jgi:hypothetical protein
MPTSSSTGEVHEIVFAQPLRSLELTVQMGDEVRWVNELEGEVHIVFLDPIDDKVDCQRGFGLIDVTNATILSPVIAQAYASPSPDQSDIPFGWIDRSRMAR